MNRWLVLIVWLLSWHAAADRSTAAKQFTKKEYLEFALRREGNAELGKALFSDENRLACAKCHTVDGTSAKAGPDLFAVGDKFGRRDLIESVLSPSATIAVGYGTTIIETKDGEEWSGVLKQVTDDVIELKNADPEPVRIRKSNIVEQRPSELSLMPEGLQDGLSLEEFNDLIEYLASLKQPESAALLETGMPRTIPMLQSPVRLEPFVAEDLAFAHPVWIGPLSGQSDAYLVLEHESGRIWRLEKKFPRDAKDLFVELGPYQKGTRGLIGLVLHPQFPSNRKYYIARHTVERGHFSTLIMEREAGSNGRTDSGKPGRLILKLDEVTGVHYGGSLAFGPDGFLYVGMGDSGPQEDPEGHGQNRALFLGKLLRIDVDHVDSGRPYAVPPRNPFVGRDETRPEIWALGFREPWRFSFDPETGDLWVGDVGQDRYEEVDIVRPGENYGWNVFEGFAPFSNRCRRESETYVPPVFAYARRYGVSVTGGYVYRADPHSKFYGVYIFGDYESRRIFGLTQENRRLQTIRQIGLSPERIVSFGRDAQGELFIVGYEGMIYRLDLRHAAFP